MISYEPLLKFLAENDLPITHLIQTGTLSSRTVAKLNKNEPLVIETIEKICKAYQLPIEKVVSILDDNGNPYVGGYIPQKIEIKKRIITQAHSTRRKKYSIKNLKKLRKEQGYTQDEAAEYVGVVKQTVSLWERNQQYVYEEYLEKLVELLKIPDENISEVE